MQGTGMLIGNFQLNHELKDINLGLAQVLFDILKFERTFTLKGDC